MLLTYLTCRGSAPLYISGGFIVFRPILHCVEFRQHGRLGIRFDAGSPVGHRHSARNSLGHMYVQHYAFIIYKIDLT